MINLLSAVVQPLLMAMEPELAHRATILALQNMPLPALVRDDPALSVAAFGLHFPNPVGMAAGFDKNAEVYAPLLRLGFGFVEVGTLTPQAQPGNERPRVFRLPGDGAIINRLGFNGSGHAAAVQRLAAHAPSGIVGINIGANKLSVDRIADYVAGIHAFADHAAYFAINVSSPNTPGLRDLQSEAALDELLAHIMEARAAVAPTRPVLLKIAPDLTLAALDAIVAVARKHQIQGMIVSNTTLARPEQLAGHRHATESGGLSGRPLFTPSTRMLAQTYMRVEQQFALIGVGGIDGPQAAYAKITAGATLVQLYTGLVFHGPHLATSIKQGLVQALKRDGFATIAEAVGTAARQWAGA